MNRRTLLLLLGIILGVFPGALPSLKADPSPFISIEPEELLGLSLQEAFQRFGSPIQVGVVRGAEPWQDDVVFIYPEGVSLFWFQDRVWQVRLATPYPGKLRGIQIGDTREQVREVLGTPYFTEEEWFLYHFVGSSFPIRIRIFFRQGTVEDIYLYRGDF
ncbi:MAG TPA: hypothetical protein PLG79_14465 [Spirochaetales bacterium]|nr:hypothetical protein [Spirochaetales bacterium]